MFTKKIRVLLLTMYLEKTCTKSIFNNNVYPSTTRYGLQTLRSFGPKIWNMIPINLRSIESLVVFKREIKKWILKNCPCKLWKEFIPHLGYLFLI